MNTGHRLNTFYDHFAFDFWPNYWQNMQANIDTVVTTLGI